MTSEIHADLRAAQGPRRGVNLSRRYALSLPNMLTYGRIAAVPLVGACIFIGGAPFRWAALGIFALAAITDFFDGYLARAWAQQSPLGRMLDSIADKVLVAACLLMLAWDNTITGWSVWAAFVILLREVLVSGLREFLAELRVSVPATQLAKYKTTAQMISLGFLLVGPAGEAVLPGNVMIGLTLLWISALLTIYTGYDYLRAGLRHVFEDPEG